MSWCGRLQLCRDPFDTSISAYNYHTQSPTPEDWVDTYTKAGLPSDDPVRCDSTPAALWFSYTSNQTSKISS